MGIWPLTRKDLMQLSRDRRALVTLLAMPMMFIAILGLSTGRLAGLVSDDGRLRLAVVDRSRSTLSADLIRALDQNEAIDLQSHDDWEQALAAVDDGDRAAGVLIGPDFMQRVDALGVQDLLEPRQGRLAEGLAGLDIHVQTKTARSVVGVRAEGEVHREAILTVTPHVARRDPVVRAYLQARGASRTTPPVASRPVVSDPEPAFAFNLSVYDVLVPAYTVMFAFFLLNFMGRSFISERELGTLQRLRAAPITPVALLAGKTLPFLLISLVQGALLLLFGRLWFGMSWGQHPWMLVPVVACTSVAATGLGLLVATVVQTESQVTSYSTLLVITLAGVSGCFMPRDWMPELMRQLSLATPHAWALIAYEQLLIVARPNLARVGECCAVLVLFGLGFFAVGWWRFRTVG